jgi:hypothetical protein
MRLDWSARRPHLAGQLGSALLSRTIELGWILRISNSRTLTISAAGDQGFADLLALPGRYQRTSLMQRFNSGGLTFSNVNELV